MRDIAGKKVWQRRDKLVAESIKYAQFLMIWESFRYRVLSDLVIVFINETVSKEKYYMLLNDSSSRTGHLIK